MKNDLIRIFLFSDAGPHFDAFPSVVLGKRPAVVASKLFVHSDAHNHKRKQTYYGCDRANSPHSGGFLLNCH